MPTGLPSVMQAKKEKMAAMLPAMEQVKPTVKKPVSVTVQQVVKEEKKVEEKPIDVAEFAVTADDLKSEEVQDEPEKKEEVTEQKPVTVEKKDDVDDDQNDYKWMYKSLKGNHDVILKENRELRDRFVALETRFEEAQKKPAEPPKPEVSLELTKEEQEQYGDALPVLSKLLEKQRRTIETSVVKPLQDEIASFKKTSDDSLKQAASNEEAIFLQHVMAQVKDFNTIVKSPKWQEFVSKPVSDYDDETVGVALKKAHDRRDLSKVLKVFENFSKSPGNTMADAFRAPSVTSAAAPLPNGKKPMLKASARQKASEDFRKGRITLERLDQIRVLYREAEAEGRIDFSH